MIILIGPSASGKTEIAKYLIKHFNYKKCVTTTTRAKRLGEIEDVDYHFVDKKTFEDELSKNMFIEHTVYQNNFYGLNRNDLKPEGIIILDPNGVNSTIAASLDVFIVYIEVDKKTRYKRMIDRGDNEESVTQRIESDDQVFSKKNIGRIDLIIHNNNDLSRAAEEINKNYQQKKYLLDKHH